jgi:hypothetical protein
MSTREELLKAKAEIEAQLARLDAYDYSHKIVVLFHPDLTEGRIPFYSKKEFYVKESEKDLKILIQLIESIYAKKYGLYDSVMGNRLVLMETFKVLLVNVDYNNYEELPALKLNDLSMNFDKAIVQLSNFLANVPIKANV